MRIEACGPKRRAFIENHYPDVIDFVDERSWLKIEKNTIVAETNTGRKVIKISELIRSKDWRKCLEDYLTLRNRGTYYREKKRPQ